MQGSFNHHIAMTLPRLDQTD